MKSKTVNLPEVQPRLLRINGVAAYLSCTVWQARQLIWSKKIPAITLGNRLLVDRVDLDRFIEQQKRAA